MMENYDKFLDGVPQLQEYYEGEPLVKPVSGVVQPNFIPSTQRPHRNTNCLTFLKDIMMKVLKDFKYSWPFTEPVDTIKEKISDYHTIITHPMDLGTINKRLTNNWYYSAAQCIEDIHLVFENCYTYNSPKRDICKMAEMLEKKFDANLKAMPTIEEELKIPIENQKINYTKRGRVVSSDTKLRNLEATQTSRKNSVASNFSSPIEGKHELPVADDTTGFSGQSTSANAVVHNLTAPITIKKDLKRKADTTFQPSTSDVFIGYLQPTKMYKPTTKSNLDRPQPNDATLKVNVSIKNKLKNDQMKFCHTLSDELFTEKHSSYAFPFYGSVDGGVSGSTNYTKIIKMPMDLKTVKHKLDTNKYQGPYEYADDMRLIFTNCYKCNSPDKIEYSLALKLQDIFEIWFSEIPDELQYSSPAIKSKLSSSFPKLGKLDWDVSSILKILPTVSVSELNDEDYKKFQKFQELIKSILKEINYLKEKNKNHARMKSLPLVPPDYPKERICGNEIKHKCQSRLNLIEKSEKIQMLHTVPDTNYDKTYTNEERMQLVQKVRNLPTEKKREVILFIKGLEPGNIYDLVGGQCEIDFKNLKPSTLSAVQKLIEKGTAPMKKPRKPYSTIKSYGELSKEKKYKLEKPLQNFAETPKLSIKRPNKKDSKDAYDSSSSGSSSSSSPSKNPRIPYDIIKSSGKIPEEQKHESGKPLQDISSTLKHSTKKANKEDSKDAYDNSPHRLSGSSDSSSGSNSRSSPSKRKRMPYDIIKSSGKISEEQKHKFGKPLLDITSAQKHSIKKANKEDSKDAYDNAPHHLSESSSSSSDSDSSSSNSSSNSSSSNSSDTEIDESPAKKKPKLQT